MKKINSESSKITVKPKVALGMSGGVDSSLVAHLLVEQGYEVTGVFLECWRAPGCRTDQDRQDALKIALDLGIPFKVLDFKQTYHDKVVQNFFDEFEAGRTPNPDVLCNKEIKFGLFYDWAMEQGFDYVATGHYAQINRTGRPSQLQIPKDKHKDQTYFLYLLTTEQLDHVLFPLGNLTKDEVRVEAKSKKLHVASKKDSVGICFIGDINVHDFLEGRLGKNPGKVIDTQGNIIGKHQGLWFYTIGQRSGFTIEQTTLVKNNDGSTITKHNIPPFYVIDKQADKNQLVVGFGEETYKDQFVVSQLHLIDPTTDLSTSDDLVVRIRHTGELLSCQVSATDWADSANSVGQGLGKVQVTLNQPTKGIAPGQSAVFYSNQTCLGGGQIS